MSQVVALHLIQDSLLEIGVLAGGETPDAAMAAFCLGRLNQVFDNYNAMKETSFVQRFETFTFVASQQDYTIGNGGEFDTNSARPESITMANVIMTDVSPTVKNPIRIRDYQWWASLPVTGIDTTFPTDLYYAPDWPLGVLHFWPVPATAYDVELVMDSTFAEVAINDVLDFPSGYRNALMLTLAEDIAPSYGKQVHPLTEKKAREARARIFSANTFVPTIRTMDAGMPNGRGLRCNWNYKTGQFITD